MCPVQARLLQLHRETEDLRAAGRIEQLVLAINRSDYMLDEPSNTLLQVPAPPPPPPSPRPHVTASAQVCGSG